MPHTSKQDLDDKPSWAPDDSESEQSPNYRRQRQLEKQQKAQEEEQGTPSLLNQAGASIQTFIQTATSTDTLGQWKLGQNKEDKTPTTSPDYKRPKPETTAVQRASSGESGNGKKDQSREGRTATSNIRQTETEQEDEALSLTSLDAKSLETVVTKVEDKPGKQPKDESQLYQDNNFDGWGEINDYDGEEEDDNSIDSGMTTRIGKKDLNKIVIPSYVRYQMMIPPEEEREEDDENPGYKDNFERIVGVIKALVQQLRAVDNTAEIISWKAQDNFTFLPRNEFPTEVANIAKYFKGFRKKMRGDRRTYIKFGLHSKKDINNLEESMKEWAGLYSYTFTKCLIQSDDAGFVGVICYTSQFTDTSVWRNHLMTVTGYEWGFKLVPITSTDKDLHWNKRLKAVGIYVPVQHVDEAKFEISELLLPEEAPSSTFPYLERFVFLPPEDTLGDEPEPLIAYQSFVMRHRSHTDNLRCKPSDHIKISLDKVLHSQSDPTLTLRKIVLGIMVKDKTNPLFGTPLFHSVDFTPDINTLWIPNKPPDMKAANIFTFYEPVKNEAQQMVAGLGRYIARMYGSDIAKQCFNNSHWKSTKGWRYRAKTGTFERPDTKNLLMTMAYDNNLSSIRRLQQISLNNAASVPPQIATTSPPSQPPSATNQSTNETADRYNDVAELLQETGSGENSTANSSGVSGLTEAVLQQENEMMKKIKDQRQQAYNLVYKDAAVKHIQVQDDQSVVSMLTDNSQEQSEDESVASSESITSASTTGSEKGNMKFTSSLLHEIITPEMNYQDALKTAEAYFKHRVNKEILHKDRILHTFLAEKFPTQHNNVTSGTDQEQHTKVDQIQEGDRDNPLEDETEDLSEIDRELSKPVGKAQRQTKNDFQQVSSDDEGEETEPAGSQNTGGEK